MFQSTFRRLTVLNSLVFLSVFVIFASAFYGYLAYRLFDQVDDALRARVNSFRLVRGRIASARVRPFFDPRIFLILRSSDGQAVSLSPFRTEESGDLTAIVADIELGDLRTKEYENHTYRVMSVPYPYEDKVLNMANVVQVQEIIAVSIVDTEVRLLHDLLWIMLGSLVLGLVGIIWAGYYLAKRAMVPIEAAWKKQQQFVADASHELRSPITGINSNAELMLRHPERTIEEESHRINNIIKETMRMAKLIAHLLTLARSDANEAELQLAPLDISELIGTVAEQFKPLAEMNQIELSVQITQKVELIADKERLHQLVVILLDNAFKYTPAGGQILISCFTADKQAVIYVQDTGQGIAPENLPRIFDRFFREDKARSRESGTGLGLAIAKWIVDKHGGKMGVESEVGKGTKFKVSFPGGNSR
ncbi:sensor histidine kinase [Acetonema longum]|uniref:histidine kinase n=1 Tax=Acetonema longum DSM 6540 TaxID=1009370 RepID=F7NMJ4_9FIRM|nr:HAMP domain-containing sensor histidine kinase [Acetonema longum]EGO62734.1 integral membrane sensor signal transduction histidine kinase [Acetonema longum DSM 6540]